MPLGPKALLTVMRNSLKEARQALDDAPAFYVLSDNPQVRRQLCAQYDALIKKHEALIAAAPEGNAQDIKPSKLVTRRMS